MRRGELDRTDAEGYLRRLGVDAEPPSADALARLHRAHVERIPYETFWIHLAEGWGIDPLESAHRLATARRGGYCFQLNGAFGTLLADLGYDVTRHVGGVHGPDGPDETELTNHMALFVSGCPSEDNPGGRWWVDAGLGDALHDPLPLIAGSYHQEPMQFVLEEVEVGGVGNWHFTHDPAASFAGLSIVAQPVDPDAFAVRHRFFSTAPDSPFARVATAQLRHATGTSILRGCVHTRVDGTAVTTRTLERVDDWIAVLADECGLVLDLPRSVRDDLWTRVRRAHESWAG